jgi:chromosome segregation ATPase
MTDERLLARLRGRGNKDTIAAADRIEALNEQLKTVLDREAATTARYDSKLETLTEQLEAARADAKEAEAYAEELDAKLGQAMRLLTEAAVQLEEGKIKTRRNMAQIIWKAIDEMANSGIGKAFDDDAEGLREKLGWSDAP